MSKNIWTTIDGTKFFFPFLSASSHFQTRSCPSVGRSVSWLVSRSRKCLKCAKRPILTHFFIPITSHSPQHSFFHPFSHSFIFSFIHNVHSITLNQRGALRLRLESFPRSVSSSIFCMDLLSAFNNASFKFQDSGSNTLEVMSICLNHIKLKKFQENF